MTPEEIQRIMALQAQLSQQSQAGNPLLAGNDGLRQQFAADPSLAPANSAQWLDERQAHILGNDAPPVITATAPMSAPPSPPPMLPQMPSTAPNPPLQSPQAVSAPQQPPMLAQPPQALPAPPLPPQSAPQLPQQAQITPFAQQAPVMAQVSPAPAVAAHANIDNSITPSHPTFTQAYQPPPLPTFMASGLAPNLGGYKPAPQMPGYAMPRTGSPFMGAHPAAQAPQLPSFSSPFASPGGPIAGGGGISAPTFAQTPYDENFYARLMMPGSTSQF